MINIPKVMNELNSRKLIRRNTICESDEKKRIERKDATRARIWCFTINNFDEKDQAHLTQTKFQNGAKYVCWQIEEGKNEVPHIQGVVQFKSQKSFKTLKKEMPRAHLEVCRNLEASKIYCQKKDTRIDGPFIYPNPKKKMTIKEICQKMKEINPYKFINWIPEEVSEAEMDWREQIAIEEG